MITIETADNALKTFYLDAVTNALNEKINPLLAKIERSSENVVGKEVKKFVKTGLSGGISAGSETGDLPEASERNSCCFVSSLKNFYGTIEISDKALRASANNEGAFVNILNDEMQSLVHSAKINFGRMLFGDGSGYLGTARGQAENNAMIVMALVENFIEGMVVDFFTESGESVPGYQGVTVTGVDRENAYLYLKGVPESANLNDTALVYVHDSKGYELTGLKAIFDTEKPLYGVERKANPVMKPYNATGGTFNEMELQKALDMIEMRSGYKTNFIVCSWGVRRKIIELYSNRGTTLPMLEIQGGEQAISFNGIPIVADRFCPKGTIYFLNTDFFKIHQLCDWKWLEGEDGKILKQIPGKPVYTATLVKYAELMCENPAAQGCITNITEN